MKYDKIGNYKVKARLRIPEKIKVFTMAAQLHLELNENIIFIYKGIKQIIQEKTKEYCNSTLQHDRFTLTINTDEFKIIKPVTLVILIKKKKLKRRD